jgi:hypothetical protein
MNKFLAKVILVYGLCYLPASASAGVKVTVGGSVHSNWAHTQQSKAFQYQNPSQYRSSIAEEKLPNNNIATDAHLRFKISGIADSGIKYGGWILLNANTSWAKKQTFGHSEEAKGIAEQMMTYLEGGYGRIEIGSYTGVSNAMKVNAATFASATGGINGDAQYHWNRRTITGRGRTATEFLQTPNLPTNELGTVGIKGINAAKFNYYTPRFSGFRLGISYIPDSKTYGSASQAINVIKNGEGFKDIFEAGISYAGEIKNVGIKIAAVGEFGKNKDIKRQDLQAWEMGMNVSHRGFVIGGSYGSWGKYNMLKANLIVLGRTNYWTVGLGCAQGPFTTSITYLRGKKMASQLIGQDNSRPNTLRNTVLGVDYKIAPGLLSYVEFASFKMDEKSPNRQRDRKGNRGHIFITGIKLSF